VKIKKFTARTEQEAIEMVKNALGLDALVLNIKKVQPQGWVAFFRKPSVEITAAYEENATPVFKREPLPHPSETTVNHGAGTEKNGGNPQRQREETASAAWPERNTVAREHEQDENPETAGTWNDDGTKTYRLGDIDKQRLITQQVKINMLEQELDNKENLLEKAASLLSAAAHKEKSYGKRKYENNLIQIFYDALTAQGVTGEIAEHLLYDVNSLVNPTELPLIVKVVYNNIVGILSGASPDGASPDGVYFFLGPTGVGKTTTIAKLSSRFVFNDGAKVGLVTADTYRIAAVEQLKTYAEILGIDITIVYNAVDLQDILPKMESFSDVVLIDTAGRSHKNAEAVKDLTELVNVRPDAKKFLVLSLTTKYDDLLSIVRAYSEFADFDIIFTKADETLYFGTILNICYLTGKKAVYITNGQNVPDDISVIDPYKIAKSLMGLGGNL